MVSSRRGESPSEKKKGFIPYQPASRAARSSRGHMMQARAAVSVPATVVMDLASYFAGSAEVASRKRDLRPRVSGGEW